MNGAVHRLRDAARSPLVTLACAALVSGSTACESEGDARSAEIAGVLVRADAATLTTRRALVEGKYARMATTPYEFFRGTFALFLHDLEMGETDPYHVPVDAAAMPLSIGDAHVENFGTFPVTGADGIPTFPLEPNDCDAGDRWFYLVELRRLTVALLIAAHVSNPSDATARDAAIAGGEEYARAAATAYATEIDRLANNEPTTLTPSRVLDDLVRRSRNDLRDKSELAERTRVEGGARALVRGGIDEDDPVNVYVDLADVARDALPATLEGYRASLQSPPEQGFFRIKDAVRELGSGVASFPRVRVIALCEGPTDALDDDVLLEIKELGDGGAQLVEPPFVTADDIGARVEACVATAVGDPAPDPLWGTGTLLGLPVQIRRDREAQKTLRTRRLEDELGTPAEITALAAALGQRLARVHARSGRDVTSAIRANVAARGARFADEEAAFAGAYAGRVIADHARFRLLLDRLGPALGFRAERDDQLPPDVAALLGVSRNESLR